MRIQRVGGAGDPNTPLKKYKAIGLRSKTGQDPLENHKATKLVFNVGLLSARKLNGVSLADR